MSDGVINRFISVRRRKTDIRELFRGHTGDTASNFSLSIMGPKARRRDIGLRNQISRVAGQRRSPPTHPSGSNPQIRDADHSKNTCIVGQTCRRTGGTQLVQHQQGFVVRRGLAGVKSTETPRAHAGSSFDGQSRLHHDRWPAQRTNDHPDGGTKDLDAAGRGDWSRVAQDRDGSQQAEARLG
jgi:hypothetical protein